MIAFVSLYEEALPRVLKWRSDVEVSHYLFTDIESDMEQQHRWFRNISADPGCRHWLIRCGDQEVGLAYLSDMDATNRRCSCGFYIGEKPYRRFGGVILPGIVNYVFEELEYNKIYGEVMAGNDNVIKLHEIHGYRQVGVWQQHILKYGAWHDVYLFELLRHRWEELGSHYRQFRIPVMDKKECGKCE
jgi:UDP-4-amino-4,6-dideoxy-N-acetyl-beta-L-altrosamine N-acetyltransferase